MAAMVLPVIHAVLPVIQAALGRRISRISIPSIAVNPPATPSRQATLRALSTPITFVVIVTVVAAVIAGRLTSSLPGRLAIGSMIVAVAVVIWLVRAERARIAAEQQTPRR